LSAALRFGAPHFRARGQIGESDARRYRDDRARIQEATVTIVEHIAIDLQAVDEKAVLAADSNDVNVSALSVVKLSTPGDVGMTCTSPGKTPVETAP
jgi:hypothetical protein